MTRINVGVLPIELPSKLLLAEHREITRIPNAIKSGKANLSQILPDKFTLNAGHVKFFYKRCTYLKNRYIALYCECVKRGFNITDKSTAFDDLPQESLGDYEPSPEDRQLIVDRIESKGFQLVSLYIEEQKC